MARSSKYQERYLKRKKLDDDLMDAYEQGSAPAEFNRPTYDLSRVIYVLRHGRTALDPMHRSDGWLDFPLSDDGRQRLITAQQYLSHIPIKAIWAPTLKRTKETAEILQSGILTNPPIHLDDDARTWNLGAIAGTAKKPNKPLVEHYIDNPDETPMGGESRTEFRKRFLPWLKKRQADAKDKKGPLLLIESGSNLREISFDLYGDKNILDLDESGLMMMMPIGDTWAAKVLFGHKDENNEWLS
jgi:broad specificity phosphatase PhoE